MQSCLSYCLNALKGPSNYTPYMTCVGFSNPPKKGKFLVYLEPKWPLVLVGVWTFFLEDWSPKTVDKQVPTCEDSTKKTKTGLQLVVSTPLKNICQNGNIPQIGVKIKKYLEPVEMFLWNSSHSVHLSMAPPIAERTLESSLDEKLNEWKLGGDASSGCGEGKVAMDGSTRMSMEVSNYS